MKARQIILLIISIAIVFGSVKIAQTLVSSKKPQDKNEAPTSVKTVNTFTASNGEVQSTIPVTGKLVAEKKIELYAEVSGMLQSQNKAFKEGNTFGKGEVLLSIDDSEFRLSILSQKSALLNSFTQLLPDLRIDFPDSYEKWNNYLKGYKIEGPLPALPELADEKEKYFLAARNIFGQYYNIKSLEEKLDKYTISAPFDGVVTESLIDAGTSIRIGQKLGEFIAPSTYELEVAVNLKDIELLNIGDQVELRSADVAGSWQGRIKRISKKIDGATQTVRVFVGVTGSGLKEGMYLAGSIESEVVKNAMELERKLITENSEVFVVKDGALQLQPVEVIKYGTGTAIVTGLPAGAEIVTSTLVGAYAGMPVRKIESK